MLLLKLLGFALLVFGAKLWLVGSYGIAVPLWDAWRQEGIRLYKPWLEHALTWDQLFVNNNVHHIACTRLLDLFLFALNGNQWDVRAQLAANALLHTVGSTCILAMVYTRLGGLAGNLALGALGLCLAFPFGYTNTLWGFQSQFYFLIFFSLVTLWGLLAEPSEPTITGDRAGWRWRQACGCLAAFLACFTMGSGFVAAGIACVLVVARAWRQRRWRPVWPSLCAGTLATLLGLGLFASSLSQKRQNRQDDAPTQELTARVVAGRLGSKAGLLLDAGAVTGWPLGGGTWALGGLLLYAPFGIWSWRQWRARAIAQPRPDFSAPEEPAAEPSGALIDRWFFAGFGLWALAQATSIALLRGVPPGSRHLDVLLFGLVTNLLALGLLWRGVYASGTGRTVQTRRLVVGGLGTLGWLLLVAVGLCGTGNQVWHSDLPTWKAKMPVFQNAVVQYLATEDSDYLEDNPPPFLNQPKWKKLERFLDEPSLQQALASTLDQSKVGSALASATLTRRTLLGLPKLALPCAAAGGALLLFAFGTQALLARRLLVENKKAAP